MFFFLFTCPSVSRPLVSRNVDYPVVQSTEGSRHEVLFHCVITDVLCAQLITSFVVLNIALIKAFSRPDFSAVIKERKHPSGGKEQAMSLWRR